MKSTLVLYTLSVINVCLLSSQCQSQDKSPLYFLSLLPYPDPRPLYQPSWDEGPTLFIAEQLAVDHINQRNDILTNYTVQIVKGDSGCNLELKAFLTFVQYLVHNKEMKIAGVVGPGCSTSTAAVSPLMMRSGIALINIHIAGSLQLADRQRYSNSFSMLDSTEVFVDASLALIAQNQWSQFATLYDASRLYYYRTVQEFERNITRRSNTTLAYSSAVYDTFIPLDVIKQQYIRIIFLFVGPDFLSKVFCLAFHLDMLFPLHQWVIISRTAQEIRPISFLYGGRNYSCDAADVARVSYGSLIIHYQLTALEKDNLTDTGVSYETFSKQYLERISEFNANSSSKDNIDPSFWAASFYDAVWALALGLNNSIEDLEDQNLSLSRYSYGQPTITSIVKQSILDLSFQGVSGLINFKASDGYTTRVVNLYQIHDSNATLVAYFSNGSILNIQPDGYQYVDSNFDEVFSSPIPAVLAAFVLLAMAVAVVLAVVINIVTLIYVKYRTVKASSPQLTYIAFAGCYVIIFAEVLYTVSMVSTKYPGSRCIPDYMWRSMIHIGLTLILSIIATRTWRIYRIFIYFENPGHFLSNRALVGIICTLMLVDVVVLVVWVVTDPLEPCVTSQYTDSGTQPFISTLVVCTQNYPLAWFGGLLGYNYLLMLLALWLTLKSRHIHSKAFRTRGLTLLVYITSLVTGVGFPLYAVLNITESRIAEFVTLASVLGIVIYLTIFLLFLPPLLPLLHEKFPQIKRVYNKTITQNVSC